MAGPPVDSDLPVSRASFGETREQRAANACSYVRAIRRGFAEVWIEVMAGDADGNLVPHRRRLDLVEAEGRYGEPEWAQARTDDHGRTRVRERGVWRSWRAAEACRPVGRGRAPRPAQNGRTRGSRRTSARSSGGGSSGDDEGESEPPGGRHHLHLIGGRT